MSEYLCSFLDAKSLCHAHEAFASGVKGHPKLKVLVDSLNSRGLWATRLSEDFKNNGNSTKQTLQTTQHNTIQQHSTTHTTSKPKCKHKHKYNTTPTTVLQRNMPEARMKPKKAYLERRVDYVAELKEQEKQRKM